MLDSNYFKFATKIWATGTLVSPTLMAIWMYFVEHREFDLALVPGSMVAGTFFSIPIWLLFLFLVRCIFREFYNDFIRKGFTLLSVLILGGSLFYFLFWMEGSADILLSLRFILPYMSTLIISVFAYDIDSDIEEINETDE
jgi:hypothetical protein